MRTRVITCAIASLIAISALAQGKAKIIIKKNINGEETLIEQEFDLGTDQEELQELMDQEGMQLKFGTAPSEDMLGLMLEGFGEFNTMPFAPGSQAPREDASGLGITVNKEASGPGVTVNTIIEATTAEAIGLLPEDVIVKFNKGDVYDLADLRRYFTATKAGDKISLEVLRAGKKKKLKGLVLDFERNTNRNQFKMFGSPFDDPQMEQQMKRMQDMMDEMHRRMEELNMQGSELYTYPQEPKTAPLLDEYMEPYDEHHGNKAPSAGMVTIHDIEKTQLKSLPKELQSKIKFKEELLLSQLLIQPLPMRGRISLSLLSKLAKDLNIEIHDHEGQLLYQEQLKDFNGEFRRSLDLSHRPAGDYYLSISDGTQGVSRKLVLN